ncbi:hypothetical protein HMPREF9120_00381 [Neisseria sp. oral taxon 020 str. F0370]|nr:hypothetical protein HMPREF9120_00381 [Neisseria sp. oral taxon 020 str. F0370]
MGLPYPFLNREIGSAEAALSDGLLPYRRGKRGRQNRRRQGVIIAFHAMRLNRSEAFCGVYPVV